MERRKDEGRTGQEDSRVEPHQHDRRKVSRVVFDEVHGEATDGSSSSSRCKVHGYLRSLSYTSAERGSKGLSCLPVVSLHAQRSSRTEADHQLEYETLRCIKQILNSWVCLGVYCRTLLDFLSPARHTRCSYSQPPRFANRVFFELTSLGF